MERCIRMLVILLSVLLPTKCCSIPSPEGPCLGKNLSYGGRMVLIDDGDDGSPPPPWTNQKIFIFRMPPSFFKRGHRLSKFPHKGIGRIWMSNDGVCPGDPTDQICPSIATQNPDAFCFEPSPECNEVLDNITLDLSSNSTEAGNATIFAQWSYSSSASSCLNVEEQNISIQLRNRGTCRPVTINSTIRALDTTTRTFEYHGRAFSTYEVTIFVVTNTGVYNQSATITTVATLPTGPPYNVRRSNCEFTTDEIIIRWNKPPCRDRNGIITKYKYEIHRDSEESPVIRYTENMTIPVYLEHPNEMYSVKLRASNEAGDGPPGIFNGTCN